MHRSRLRRRSLGYLSPSPSPREQSPRTSFTSERCDAGGDATMNMSRPSSVALLALANRPCLEDILADTAPPPWTLSAFMAYLSQNHCSETLEFIKAAERYRLTHARIADASSPSVPGEASEHACDLWRKLIRAYILPCGPREVNLPGPVRDELLALGCSSSPPNPTKLDEAVRIVYELMNDSVLLPFLESTSTHRADGTAEDAEDGSEEARQGRTRLRMPGHKESSPTADESGRSPMMAFLPQLGLGRKSDGHGARSNSSSRDGPEAEGLTDDSGGSTPLDGEPLTPPTTPPTSDWAFSTSPGTLHRAISAHNNGWKRMSARLGLRRKSTRRANTSNATAALPQLLDGDVTMSDAIPERGSAPL